MSAALRGPAALGAIAMVFAAGAPTSAQAPADTRPPCVHTLVAMNDTVDSAKARSGEVFHFVSTETVRAPDGTVVPAGTVGYGVVANASHAERGGRGGYLALETRFFVLGRRQARRRDHRPRERSSFDGSRRDGERTRHSRDDPHRRLRRRRLRLAAPRQGRDDPARARASASSSATTPRSAPAARSRPANRRRPRRPRRRRRLLRRQLPLGRPRRRRPPSRPRLSTRRSPSACSRRRSRASR